MTDVSDQASSGDGSLRDRAVERSLRAARAKAVMRSDGFLRTATELLSETGRTDFTVQELVERSKTSLRSFYQHFSSKDELLLALFEEVLGGTMSEWRKYIGDLKGGTVEQLRFVATSLYTESTNEHMAGVSRALSAYHLQLAESRPLDYARVLSPLRDLILDLVRQGVSEGKFRKDVDAEMLAMILMQTVVGAAHMHALGAELTGAPLDVDQLWAFCLSGLTGGK
jgi:AcrR family transcriptional regulator